MVHTSRPRGIAGSTNSSAHVLLVHDVENLGKRGEIVSVKPGYARNYLLPHGVATVASEGNKKMVELHKEKLKAIESSRIRDLAKIADAVSKYSATIEANATPDNALYGSVVAKDISDALKAAGHKIEAEHVRLEGAIKELGMYTVKLKLHEKVQTEVKVWVVPSDAGV
ncbi:MAG: 50S ribosomal protein L9 [Fuerstiella sp.]|nr:50S ribosomal protein L9 [Fuerstiella sp.]MCP4857109.1 50S ribosomal protein L9 [Fuerstiella sp.]